MKNKNNQDMRKKDWRRPLLLHRNHEKLHEETGRSMIETLGVLCLMGGLSLGGVYGYKYALSRYKENVAANQFAVTVAVARTSGLNKAYGNPGTHYPFSVPIRSMASGVTFNDAAGVWAQGSPAESFKTPMGADVSVTVDSPSSYAVRVSGLTAVSGARVCDKLMTMGLEENYIVVLDKATDKLTDGDLYFTNGLLEKERKAICAEALEETSQDGIIPQGFTMAFVFDENAPTMVPKAMTSSTCPNSTDYRRDAFALQPVGAIYPTIGSACSYRSSLYKKKEYSYNGANNPELDIYGGGTYGISYHIPYVTYETRNNPVAERVIDSCQTNQSEQMHGPGGYGNYGGGYYLIAYGYDDTFNIFGEPIPYGKCVRCLWAGDPGCDEVSLYPPPEGTDTDTDTRSVYIDPSDEEDVDPEETVLPKCDFEDVPAFSFPSIENHQKCCDYDGNAVTPLDDSTPHRSYMSQADRDCCELWVGSNPPITQRLMGMKNGSPHCCEKPDLIHNSVLCCDEYGHNQYPENPLHKGANAEQCCIAAGFSVYNIYGVSVSRCCASLTDAPGVDPCVGFKHYIYY